MGKREILDHLEFEWAYRDHDTQMIGQLKNKPYMKILDDVKKTIGERQEYYSDFSQTMELTAEIASKVIGCELSGADVALIYAINKIVRGRGIMKRDNILDAIAYLAIIDELVKWPEDEDNSLPLD